MRNLQKCYVLKWIPLSAWALILLQGCVTVGPEYSTPKLNIQDEWNKAITEDFSDGEASLQTWWTVFNDPILDSLIERAGQGSLKLREAYAKITETRAVRGIKESERSPNVNVSGSATKSSIDTKHNSTTVDSAQFGGDASWEIDFWGRISRSVESADAGLEASIEDYRDVLVLLFAEVASNYIEVRKLQNQIQSLQMNIDAQRKTVEITQSRVEAGLTSALDVMQAELNLTRTESNLPSLQKLLVQAINRISVLLGKPPGTLQSELEQTVPIPNPTKKISIGVPANLLRQRPDIRKAERELAAQTALIGVATADLYPRFSLSGSFSLKATDLGSNATTFGLGPTMQWNVFSGGRIRNQIKVEDARTEQALARYEQQVLDALEDVENALVSFRRERERMEKLALSVIEAEKSVELVKFRYTSGLADFQDVLDMQRSLYEQQDQYVESEGNMIQNLKRLYKALGGGWNPEIEPKET